VKKITAFVQVYNEEGRIASLIENFSWVDEIIIFNKESTDRTKKIAIELGATVIDMPFSEASENFAKYINRNLENTEWCIFPTPSSLIHPELAYDILDQIKNPLFEYEAIALPYLMYVLNISSKYSPWGGEYKIICIKKSALILTDILHNEIGFDTKKILKINNSLSKKNYALFHCTHKSVDDFFTNHMRYTRYEANYYRNNNKVIKLFPLFKEFLISICTVLIRRKTYMLGWDGVALALGYISYFQMKFIYAWEQKKLDKNPYKIQFSEMSKLWKMHKKKNDTRIL